MSPRDIGESAAVRSPGGESIGAGDAMTGPATVAGSGLGVASPAIGRSTVGNGIYPKGTAIGMAGNAAGKGRRPGRR